MRNIYAYAWDFIDEGLDQVLEKIKSLGMDGVALAVSYHAGKFILPHNPKHRVYFPEDGTVYYRPRAEFYPGPLKPAVASILGTDCVLADVADACKRHDLKLTAWTVCMHNTRLGTKHQEFIAANAFGDRYPYCLCPAQPAPAEYVLGMIGDLAHNYELDTVFLEALGYMGFAHGFHHEFYGISPSACVQRLLSLCFCEACAAKAAESGIDADRVAAIVRENCAPAFTRDVAPESWEFSSLVDANPELAAYLNMRCGVVLDLLAQARALCEAENVKVDYFGPSPCSRALPEATDMARAAAIADHYVIPVGTPDLSDATRDIDEAMALMPVEKIVLSINMGTSATPTKQNLREKTALVDRYGLAGCNLYNYSILPFERLGWLNDV